MPDHKIRHLSFDRRDLMKLGAGVVMTTVAASRSSGQTLDPIRQPGEPRPHTRPGYIKPLRPARRQRSDGRFHAEDRQLRPRIWRIEHDGPGHPLGEPHNGGLDGGTRLRVRGGGVPVSAPVWRACRLPVNSIPPSWGTESRPHQNSPRSPMAVWCVTRTSTTTRRVGTTATSYRRPSRSVRLCIPAGRRS